MERALHVAPAGSWPPEAAIDRVRLDSEARQCRRRRLRAEGGLELLVDLPATCALREGDGLVLDDGRIVAIAAAPERLIEARGPDAAALARLAWHIGNRHLPIEVCADALRLRADPVIADMLRGLGASVAEIEAPFEPEAGAYAPRHGAADHGGADHG
jgi:urease accessory protein